MIALLLALSLSPAAASARPSPELAPLTAPSSVDQSDGAPAVTEAQVVQLQALFDQSCAQKAYATYDDLCEALKTQVQIAQRAANRAKRKRAIVTVMPTQNP